MPTPAARPQSVLTQVIEAIAHRLAQHPDIPVCNRDAFRANATSVMHQQWASVFGGESVWLRLYVPNMPSSAREIRRARILSALAAGEPKAVVAKRERVSLRWVQRLAADSSEPPAR
jgi:hypothetical protein